MSPLSAPNDRGQWYGAFVAIVALVGMCLAVAVCRSRELWLDEYHTWLLSGMSLRDLWTYVTGDVHPPVYFLLMNGWRRLFGDDTMVLRLSSILVYVASVGVFAALVRRERGATLASTAAVCLFSFSPAVVYYGTEVRMYALLVLLACVAIWLWVGLLDRARDTGTTQRLPALALGVAAVLLMLTHYTGLFFVAGLGLAWLLQCALGRVPWRPFLAFALVTGSGGGLWAPTIVSQRSEKAGSSRAYVEAKAATAPVVSESGSASVGAAEPAMQRLVSWHKEVVANLASISGVFPSSQRMLLVLFALPFLAIAGGVVITLWERDPIALSMLVVVAAVVAGTQVVPVQRRFLIVSAPAMFMLVFRGLDELQRRRPALAVAGPLAGLVALAGCVRMVLLAPDKHPVASITSTIAADSAGAEPIVLLSNYAEPAVRYHLRHRQPMPHLRSFPIPIDRWWASHTFKGWATVPVSRDSTERWVAGLDFDRGWLIEFESESQDPWGYLERSIEQRFNREERLRNELEGTGWRLFRLERRGGVADENSSEARPEFR
jgi:hypothetical protein